MTDESGRERPSAPSLPGPLIRGRRETAKERLDRELTEMLQGFRVAVTGVQVLFAFLLTVPFQPGFGKVDSGGRDLFYTALASATLSSLCFIAPSIQHRILFRSGHKERLIQRGNRYGIVGALLLAVSMGAAAALIVEVLVGGTVAALAGAGAGLVAAWTWFVQPLLSRARWDRADAPDGATGHGSQAEGQDRTGQE